MLNIQSRKRSINGSTRALVNGATDRRSSSTAPTQRKPRSNGVSEQNAFSLLHSSHKLHGPFPPSHQFKCFPRSRHSTGHKTRVQLERPATLCLADARPRGALPRHRLIQSSQPSYRCSFLLSPFGMRKLKPGRVLNCLSQGHTSNGTTGTSIHVSLTPILSTAPSF